MRSVFIIGGAISVGIVLVGGALYARLNDNTDVAATGTNNPIVVGTAPQKQYIQTEDTDDDGVADWREELYGTDPQTFNEFTDITTDKSVSSTEPIENGTFTEQFARTFFEDLARSDGVGYNFFAPTEEELVESAVASVVALGSNNQYSVDDIRISEDSSTAALRAYGNTIASVIILNDIEIEGPLAILAYALQTENEADLAGLEVFAASYRSLIEDLLVIEAPRSIHQEHLNFLNSVTALYVDIVAMQRAFSDPLLTIPRVQRYQDDQVGFSLSLDALRIKLLESGVRYTESEPAYPFSVF